MKWRLLTGRLAAVALALALAALGPRSLDPHSAAAQGSCVLYGANGAGGGDPPGSSTLFVLNPNTGAAISSVGPIGFPITGLAVDPRTGTLYGSTSAAPA